MSVFFNRLQSTMREQGISQCELSRMIGVSQHTVWKWTHEQLPSLERFRQLCDMLNANPAYLLGLVD